MNDTDKLIAAIYAATMISRVDASNTGTTPLGDFLGHFDTCFGELREREIQAAAEAAARKIEEQKKAWG